MPNRLILKHNDRLYFGYATSIAKRIVGNDAHPELLADTIREVEYHGEEVVIDRTDTVLQVFDADGEELDLPLDHWAVDEDTLIARRDNVRDVFLPDALDTYGRKLYRAELDDLNDELDRRGA